jgi:alpha-1,3-rhamnosyl/mannosyltransferase
MVHDVAWRTEPSAYPRRGLVWHEKALRRVAKRAAAVVTPSAAASAAVLGATDLDPAAVVVIPHGCDHLAAPDLVGAQALLAKLGVTDGYLLTVSTLEPRKNLGRLAAAYEKARAGLPVKWPLVVVGPSGWGESLRPREGVILAGPVSGALLSGLYAGAALVAYVPLDEGFGLPAIEAMSLGTVVLASAGVPSVAELAPGCARVVDPRSVEAIADGMSSLAGDEAARRAMGNAGRAAVTAHTWAKSAEEHLALWSRLATS